MSYWLGRRTLVTGASGFVGSHLVSALVAAGAQVRALCRYNSRGDRGALDWLHAAELAEVEIQFGDIRDPDCAERAVTGVELAFHLAALIAVPYSYLAPRDYVETNVVGTLNLAQAALRADLRRFVHVSTSEVYGDCDTQPISERASPAPRSPYAASKAAADLLLQSFESAFRLPLTIARPFNAYGPRQSARAIVPTIAMQALAGDRIRLGSLAPRRDLTFVSDTVAGLLAVGASEAAAGRTVQLGTGADVSVQELVVLVAELVGRKLTPELDAERVRPATSEVDRLVCDNSLAIELTGWRPAVALRDGLARTVAWIDTHRDSYRAGEYQR